MHVLRPQRGGLATLLPTVLGWGLLCGGDARADATDECDAACGPQPVPWTVVDVTLSADFPIDVEDELEQALAEATTESVAICLEGQIGTAQIGASLQPVGLKNIDHNLLLCGAGSYDGDDYTHLWPMELQAASDDITIQVKNLKLLGDGGTGTGILLRRGSLEVVNSRWRAPAPLVTTASAEGDEYEGSLVFSHIGLGSGTASLLSACGNGHTVSVAFDSDELFPGGFASRLTSLMQVTEGCATAPSLALTGSLRSTSTRSLASIVDAESPFASVHAAELSVGGFYCATACIAARDRVIWRDSVLSSEAINGFTWMQSEGDILVRDLDVSTLVPSVLADARSEVVSLRTQTCSREATDSDTVRPVFAVRDPTASVTVYNGLFREAFRAAPLVAFAAADGTNAVRLRGATLVTDVGVMDAEVGGTVDAVNVAVGTVGVDKTAAELLAGSEDADAADVHAGPASELFGSPASASDCLEPVVLGSEVTWDLGTSSRSDGAALGSLAQLELAALLAEQGDADAAVLASLDGSWCDGDATAPDIGAYSGPLGDAALLNGLEPREGEACSSAGDTSDPSEDTGQDDVVDTAVDSPRVRVRGWGYGAVCGLGAGGAAAAPFVFLVAIIRRRDGAEEGQ